MSHLSIHQKESLWQASWCCQDLGTLPSQPFAPAMTSGVEEEEEEVGGRVTCRHHLQS